MNCLKTGVASVTFRNKCIEEIIEICKKENVNYIEWGSDVHVKSHEDALKAKKLCDEAGITICSYGSYYKVGYGNQDEWKALCENAHAMGAKSIRVWLGNKSSQKVSDKEYSQILEDCKSICDTANKYQLIVSPECHDNTLNDNTDVIIKFIAELDRCNFKTYFQSRYFRMNYDIDRIDRTFEHILNVHVSYSDLKKEQLLRKKDKNYIDTLIKKLISKDFGGIILLEFTDNSSVKSFSKDIEKLKQYRW